MPSRFLPPPARACETAAAGKAGRAPRGAPGPAAGWAGPAAPVGGGRAAAGVWPPPSSAREGLPGGRGAAPPPPFSRPARAAVGAAGVSPAAGASPPAPNRGGPCARSRVFPSVFCLQSREEGVRSLSFILLFPLVLPGSAQFLVFDTGRL